MTRDRDWKGERKQKYKRGFAAKRGAQDRKKNFHMQNAADLDMTFRSFVEHYEEDRRSRIKNSTWESKEHIIRTKLLHYFGKLKISIITPQQIVRWQNEQTNYRDKPYLPVYLKSSHNQLSAIFNHAVRYYNLRENPCIKSRKYGQRETQGDTKEEYRKFAAEMMEKPIQVPTIV